MGQRRREREAPGLGLKRPPLAQPMQQPTKKQYQQRGGYYLRDFAAAERWGRTITRRFGWQFDSRKI
jgi:hypothetical protein